MRPRPTIDEHAVRAAGGRVLEGGEGIEVGGWAIETRSSSITSDAELERLKEQLGVLVAPEQFFGGNELTLRHLATGATLRFDALGALKGWVADKSPAVVIDEAAAWQRSREKDMQETGAKPLHYDWTFTTNYDGGLEQSASAAAAAEAAEGDAAGGDGPAAAAAGAVRWEGGSEQINRGMLMNRDPILLWCELPLYESELEDHGTSQMSVKVRVMPRCWYVLLRFFLRVDHVLVRLREARLFCQFSPPEGVVVREVKYSEGTFKELQKGGAPPEGPAYADGDAASAALQAVAPVGVTLFKLEKLQLPQ